MTENYNLGFKKKINLVHFRKAPFAQLSTQLATLNTSLSNLVLENKTEFLH